MGVSGVTGGLRRWGPVPPRCLGVSGFCEHALAPLALALAGPSLSLAPIRAMDGKCNGPPCLGLVASEGRLRLYCAATYRVTHARAPGALSLSVSKKSKSKMCAALSALCESLFVFVLWPWACGRCHAAPSIALSARVPPRPAAGNTGRAAGACPGAAGATRMQRGTRHGRSLKKFVSFFVLRPPVGARFTHLVTFYGRRVKVEKVDFSLPHRGAPGPGGGSGQGPRAAGPRGVPPPAKIHPTWYAVYGQCIIYHTSYRFRRGPLHLKMSIDSSS